MSGRALITGAGSGIGRATARAFLAVGWQVALLGRRAEALEETAQGAAALILVCDVSDPAQVEAAFARVQADWGGLDLLFNNAGVSARAAPIDEIPIADWLAVNATNINGMFYCARAAFGLMRRQIPQGGRIINNGSISAHAPRPHSIAYASTKHAVTGLTKSAALDGRRYDIAVGQIDIGNAATEMAQRMATGVIQANGEIAIEALMDVAVVGQSVLYMANLPLSANVLFHTVMATKMPFVGRG